MWLKTQTKGYVNADQVLSIGLGHDPAGRVVVVASLLGLKPGAPDLIGIVTAQLAGPFLPDEHGEERALAVLDRLMGQVSAGRIWKGPG